jgi:phenylacetate-coenzyme A ligase PaaK-like adenylate-forming protein
MAGRSAAFLHTLEKAVFSYPRSPYLKLFQHAGCNFEDVRDLVTRIGLEKALHSLLEAGIYVTFEEFKGKQPVRRGSKIFTFHDADFNNPLITRHYESSSGGTSGIPVRIHVDLDHITQSAPHWAVLFAEHDALNAPLVLWTPAHSGMANRYLMCAKFGKRFDKWFTFMRLGAMGGRLIASCVHNLSRYVGRFPKPTYVPLNEAATIALHLIRLRDSGTCPSIITPSSAAIRICKAAEELKATLEDVTFILGAEPLTEARRDSVVRSGAEAVAVYGFSEGGGVGGQCRCASSADDVHVFMDAFAVIQRERTFLEENRSDALLFTALRSACPKIMINAEIGDSAVSESRSCSCRFGELGYLQHLKRIRSFDKLTGEGMTVHVADLYPILEKVLPRRFGGLPGHYQLVEEQGSDGLTKYRIIVSPDVGLVDAAAVRSVFIQKSRAIKKKRNADMVDLWSEAGSVTVIRRSPYATGRGKVLPFITLR